MKSTTTTSSRSARPLRAWILLPAMFLAGCGSTESFLLDSDVPIPQESAGRATSGIERTSGLLTGVDTVFATKVEDPVSRIDVLAARFRTSGWTIESRSSTASTATAIFMKVDRRCRVRILRNELDPSMSRVAYNIWTVDDSETVSNAGSGRVDD